MLWKLFFLFLSHFVGDFLLQGRKDAVRKHESKRALVKHSIEYTIPFGFLFRQQRPELLFILLSHLVVDFFSSRLTAKFYKEERMYAFWLTIGFDQLLHTMSLLAVAQMSGMLG